jgi:hypothetical protein
MAISRGAGTEIIRSVHFEDVDNTAEKIIIGVQHHIYTVLSVICYCANRNASENAYLGIQGYDSNAGTTNQTHWLSKISCAQGETFVFNDKFSFNGFEPTDFAGPMDNATKQDAIADQGSSVAQYLFFQTDGGSTQYDLTVSFIDQNNA